MAGMCKIVNLWFNILYLILAFLIKSYIYIYTNRLPSISMHTNQLFKFLCKKKTMKYVDLVKCQNSGTSELIPGYKITV